VTPLDGIPSQRHPDAPHLLTPRAQRTLEAIDGRTLDEMRALRDETERFMLRYKFGMDEVITKLSILREEFSQNHDYNPIEHISSRLKSLDSVIAKMQRKGIEPTFDTIRDTVTDIAGVRVTCSFVSDIYKVRDMIAAQQDLVVLEERDYISHPKGNGYKSLHLIVEVPVFLSDRVQPVVVEIQIRTIAMDFWASLEHKIYYKYDKAVPQRLLDELKEASLAASERDEKMERLHDEVLQHSRDTATEHPEGKSASPFAPSWELLDSYLRGKPGAMGAAGASGVPAAVEPGDAPAAG
jgi:putative GTP pyrophosphokinase